MEAEWFPPLREKYPMSMIEGKKGEWSGLTSQDENYIRMFHTPEQASEACINFSPAHLVRPLNLSMSNGSTRNHLQHINLLPEAQRQGWGRKLIDRAVVYLRDEVGLDGVWLGMDSRNKDAATFYERLGFRAVEGAPENYVGLKFVDWRSER